MSRGDQGIMPSRRPDAEEDHGQVGHPIRGTRGKRDQPLLENAMDALDHSIGLWVVGGGPEHLDTESGHKF